MSRKPPRQDDRAGCGGQFLVCEAEDGSSRTSARGFMTLCARF